MKTRIVAVALFACIIMLTCVLPSSVQSGVVFLYRESLGTSWYRDVYEDIAHNAYFYHWSADHPNYPDDWTTASAGGGQVILSTVGSDVVWDGQLHTFMIAPFSYRYDDTYGLMIWHNNHLNLDQFRYWYPTTYWEHSGKNGSWATLTGGGETIEVAYSFGGNWFNLNNNWQYGCGDTFGAWRLQGSPDMQFAYNYDSGEWYQHGVYGGWSALGLQYQDQRSPNGFPGPSTGLSATFIGGGDWIDLQDGYYLYRWTGGKFGLWYYVRLGVIDYAYDYMTGQWYHEGRYGGWATLGNPGLSSWFIGDWHWNGIDNTWYYWNGGRYRNSHVNFLQFTYDPFTGQWFHQGWYGNETPLTSGGQPAWFIGDGNWHSLGSRLDGNWYFNYTVSGNWGSFWNSATGKAYFYDYTAGQWYQWNNGLWSPTGPSQYEPAFGYNSSFPPYSAAGTVAGVYSSSGSWNTRYLDGMPNPWSYDLNSPYYWYWWVLARRS